ncbi:MAG: 50S ribosomal protein L11 methyltransferase [Syntrophomonadaceae bacterium]|nr:50S ribosomal protein L11 methyltransferase [Syntrophomonadaceae bacterium]
MKWIEISVLVDSRGVEPVSGLFHSLNCGGVLIEDPGAGELLQQPVDEDKAEQYSLCASGTVRVKAYIHEDRQVMEQIEQALGELQELLGCTYKLETAEVRDEDWAESWKQYYHTFRVGRRLVIKPSWEQYQSQAGDVVIELDPGMAFGTGIHATTRFCLIFVEQYIKGGEKVIDAGCGSGILSLAAARLGAAEILAMDIDTVAAQIAQQNIAINGLSDKIRAVAGDIFADLKQQQADVIMANLTADIILSWLPVAVSILNQSGLLIASGIPDSRWPEVKAAMQEAGLSIEGILLDSDWVGAAARRL